MERKIFVKIVSGLLLTFLLAGCLKDNMDPDVPTSKKVMILNQGNFTEHSASISLYDEETKQIQNRAFETVNGRSIGATVVSGSLIGNTALLVCNYPDKIEIVDSWTAIAFSEPITEGLASPRNAIATTNRIYVTNWDYTYNETPSGWWIYPDSYISIYDIVSRQFIKKVKVGTDAEGLLIIGNKMFVATLEGVKVFEIMGDNLNFITVLRPQDTEGGAKHLVVDKNFMVWASFPGTGVVKIDPNTLTIKTVVDVPVDSMDGYIASDPMRGKIYTYNTTFDQNYSPVEANIYSVDTSTGQVSVFFTGTYFYGVGASPYTGNVYTAEVSFTSNSVMKTITPAGLPDGSATTGVGTFRFLFYLKGEGLD